MIRSHFTFKLVIAILGALFSATVAFSQNNNNNTGGNVFLRGVVGGIKVDANGVVRDISQQEKSDQLRQMRDGFKQPTGELSEKSNLRMISLKRLQLAIEKSLSEKTPLPPEMLYLAGLQRIEYVFAYPEQQDIVLAGPAEPWIVRDDSSVVGRNSGRPVLRLEDLLTALRSSEATRVETMSVSIDPTPEGELRLNQLLAKLGATGSFNPQTAEPLMKEALGLQTVSLTAVPKNSRMAQTLVAADYQMKRLAMKLADSPVRGLSSYLDMIRNGGGSRGAQPRWWITTNYDSLLHSEDRLAWHITGSGIKALSEDQFVTKEGQRVGTGHANKLAQKWADSFTEKYDQLCATQSVFGDLRNVIDLNVVAAIINSQRLIDVTGCNLDLLAGIQATQLETPKYEVPQSLAPQCSFVRGTNGWTISASGGVEINPWKIVSDSSKYDDAVKTTYAKAQVTTENWWWN